MGRYTLAFGWMNDPLSKQIADQGLSFNAEDMKHHELDAEAISRLRVRGVITNSEGDRAYDRLAKRVWKSVRLGETSDGGDGVPVHAPDRTPCPGLNTATQPLKGEKESGT